MTNKIVIIMAGGLGKRMNSELPKVLHQINGKPMLVHVIEQAMLLNPYKILIVVGKYKDVIKQTVLQYITDKQKSLHNISFVLQKEPLGTGNAVQCCLDELIYAPISNVIILSGDVPLLKSTTITDMLYDFKQIKITTTILNSPTGYGRIIETNKVFEKIVEEKDATEKEKRVTKVNCGIYIIRSDLLIKYLPLLTVNNSQNEYYLTDIVELIKNGENISVVMYNIPKVRQYEIMGVNTVEQLEDLEKLVTFYN